MSVKKSSLDFQPQEKYRNNNLIHRSHNIMHIAYLIQEKAHKLEMEIAMRGGPKTKFVAYLGQNQKRLPMGDLAQFPLKRTVAPFEGSTSSVVLAGCEVVFVDDPDHFNVTTINP